MPAVSLGVFLEIALREKKLNIMSPVLLQEAQTYAEDTGLLFMETSAKTAMNVNELFLAIGKPPRSLSQHREVNCVCLWREYEAKNKVAEWLFINACL